MKKKLITNTYLREADRYEIKLFLDEKDYYVSVKKLVHVTASFIIRNNITAMDNGYYILEIVPKIGNVAMRVFLNEKKEIVEYYFDMIKESGIDQEYKIPYFYDLYLDVTYFPNGEIHIVDEKELEEAYSTGDITKEDYQLALKNKDQLIKEIEQGTNTMMNMDFSTYLEGM